MKRFRIRDALLILIGIYIPLTFMSVINGDWLLVSTNLLIIVVFSFGAIRGTK